MEKKFSSSCRMANVAELLQLLGAICEFVKFIAEKLFYTICVYRTIRVRYIPHAYGTYRIRVWYEILYHTHTRMVCTIRVRLYNTRTVRIMRRIASYSISNMQNYIILCPSGLATGGRHFARIVPLIQH